jgi:hypothetical protein
LTDNQKRAIYYDNAARFLNMDNTEIIKHRTMLIRNGKLLKMTFGLKKMKLTAITNWRNLLAFIDTIEMHLAIIDFPLNKKGEAFLYSVSTQFIKGKNGMRCFVTYGAALG